VRLRTTPAVLSILLVCGLLASCDKGPDTRDAKADEGPAAPSEEPQEAAEPVQVAEVAKSDDDGQSGDDAEGEAGGTTGSSAVDDEAGDDEPAQESEPEEATKSSTKKAPEPKTKAAKTAEKPKSNDKPAAGLTMAKGKEIYAKRCRSCHGNTGAADTKMGKQHDIPAWTQSGWKAKWPVAKIKEITTNGKSGTKMKSFSDKLSAEEIEIVSKYAFSLGK
jgi:mono/diheme cytochrome c family protein